MATYNGSSISSGGTASDLLLPDGHLIPLSAEGRWIGRNDLDGHISDSLAGQISRQHLFIGRERDGYYIEDRDSTNGTRLNGVEISGTGRHPVKDGDTLELGGVVSLRFRSPGAFCPDCGTAVPSGSELCPRCSSMKAPAGTPVSPAPVATPSTPTPSAAVNSSGQGYAAIVPADIKKWNWGAFFLNWIWGIGNNVLIALLCLVPGVNFVMIFVLGARGNEWAWRNKRWDSVEQFKRTQHKWSAWGVGLFLAGIAINVLYLIVMASCLR